MMTNNKYFISSQSDPHPLLMSGSKVIWRFNENQSQNTQTMLIATSSNCPPLANKYTRRQSPVPHSAYTAYIPPDTIRHPLFRFVVILGGGR